MLQKSLLVFITLAFFLACNPKKDSSEKSTDSIDKDTVPDFQISLAQWSLHRSFFGPRDQEGYAEWYFKMLEESPDSVLRGELDPIDFPEIAKGYGINSIELVSTFYLGKVDNDEYWATFKQKCEDAGVNVGLIMCDAVGKIADADSSAQMEAIEKHHKWVDIAKFLGAHSIRVNVAGEGSREEVASNAVDGLKKLGTYGAEKDINIIVENHGGYSSDGKWLANVIQKTGMENVGTLPDFGNFCLEWGPEGCVNAYDKYQGITELMPYAKAVSAKSNAFDEQGNETESDYFRIMKIVKDSGYRGYIGIEYEGNELSEDEGIKATKALLEKAIEQL